MGFPLRAVLGFNFYFNLTLSTVWTLVKYDILLQYKIQDIYYEMCQTHKHVSGKWNAAEHCTEQVMVTVPKNATCGVFSEYIKQEINHTYTVSQ